MGTQLAEWFPGMTELRDRDIWHISRGFGVPWLEETSTVCFSMGWVQANGLVWLELPRIISPYGIQLQNSQHSRSVSATLRSRFKQEHIAPRRLEAARDLLWHGTQRNFAAPLDTTSPCHVSRSYQVTDRLDYQTLQSIPSTLGTLGTLGTLHLAAWNQDAISDLWCNKGSHFDVYLRARTSTLGLCPHHPT